MLDQAQSSDSWEWRPFMVVCVLAGVVGCHASNAAMQKPSGDIACAPATATWSMSVVNSTGTLGDGQGASGASTSLAVSGDLTTAIAYDEGDDSGTLRLATRPPGSDWMLQSLGEYGQKAGNGAGALVQFDSFGRPIVAVDSTAGYPASVDVRLGDGTVTSILLTTSGDSITGFAMVIDGLDRPRLAYGVGGSEAAGRAGDNAVMYAASDAAAWATELIKKTTLGVGQTAIALDGAGRPSVAFTEGSTLWFAQRDDSGAWTTEVIETSTMAINSPSLVIDSRNLPRIGYVDWETSTVKYAVRGDAGWQIESLGCATNVALASMVLDTSDEPHVALTPAAKSGTAPAPIQYAVHDAQGWTVEQVGASNESDVSPSLVIGTDGVARVSWADLTSRTARYAERR